MDTVGVGGTRDTDRRAQTDTTLPKPGIRPAAQRVQSVARSGPGVKVRGPAWGGIGAAGVMLAITS